MASLASLFAKDSASAVLVFQAPTSYIEPPDSNPLFLNNRWYKISDARDDTAKESDLAMEFRSVAPFRSLSLFSGRVSVLRSGYNYPPVALLNHWADKFHEGVPLEIDFVSDVRDSRPHVVFNPVQNFPKSAHAVDPDILYRVSSKRFLEEVNGPKPRVLDLADPELPCVLKLCMSRGGRGTFLIPDATTFKETLEGIRSRMPDADVIATELIPNVTRQYGAHAYLSKTGECTWLGVRRQKVDSAFNYQWFEYHADEQEEAKRFVMPAFAPVLSALHKRGYFGYVSADILVNDAGAAYVVDINPRWSGAAVIVVGMRVMARRGYKVGLQVCRMPYRGSLTRILGIVSSVVGGEVVLTTATTSDPSGGLCEIAVFAPNIDKCWELHDTCKEKFVEPIC